jgi:hypothetical protein
MRMRAHSQRIMLTPRQCIARALLGWTQRDLQAATVDERTGQRVSWVTIGEFERGPD